MKDQQFLLRHRLYLLDGGTIVAQGTPEEVRAHRELVRRREYAKYAARTRLGMFWNKMQYRRWRALSKSLQRKGILPPNEA